MQLFLLFFFLDYLRSNGLGIIHKNSAFSVNSSEIASINKLKPSTKHDRHLHLGFFFFLWIGLNQYCSISVSLIKCIENKSFDAFSKLEEIQPVPPAFSPNPHLKTFVLTFRTDRQGNVSFS